MILVFKKRFDKSYSKLPLKVRSKVDSAVFIFRNNPFDPILRNHVPFGEYRNCRSLDVTGDYRIIFCEIETGYEIVELIDIGRHSKLYNE